MRNFARLLLALFVLFLSVVILFFVLENQQSVSLAVLGWVSPAVPIAVLVMAVLAIGLILGAVMTIGMVWRKRPLKVDE